MAKGDDIDEIIANGGVIFHGAKSGADDKDKVKTKAKKKKYITGAHGIWFSQTKGEIPRAARQPRHKK
jgi:hypothetical protein